MWKDIPWYEWLYQVSNTWELKSIRKWKILSPRYHKQWYLLVNLYKNKQCKTCKIHRIVAITFIKNKDSLPQVNHIDWIKDNNDVSNLEWCNAKTNTRHAFVKWLCNNNHFITNNPSKWKFWKDSKHSVSIIQSSLNGQYIATWDSMADAYRTLWILVESIGACCRWKTKTAWWFTWKYDNSGWQ